MKHKRNIFFPALLAPAFLAVSERAETPSFHPEEGTEVSKRALLQMELVLEDMSMSMNGNEMDPGMLQMEMSTTMEQTVAVTDTYETVESGEPKRLTRTFDELGSSTNVSNSNAMTGDSESEIPGSSDLEGLSVVFTLDEDTGEYDVAFADDSDGDDELLEGLDAGMDLRELLPDSEVSEGDTWEVDASVVRNLLAPGGALKIEPDPDSMPMGGMGGSGPQGSPAELLGDFDGDVTAEFVGTRDEDGTRVAVINLEIDVLSAKDMTEAFEEMMENLPPEAGDLEADIEMMDMEHAFVGEGVLLWNMDSGLFHSLELSCEVTQNIDQAMTLVTPQGEMAIEQSMSFGGTSTVTITTGE